MKISTVKIKNFRGYGENHHTTDGYYTFNDLDKCDFLILNGYNGFGKTSFFEAIEWCLTNSVKRLKSFEENDTKANLGSNRYLIFIPKNQEKRTADIEITFSDGMSIKRTTSSESLQAKDYTAKTVLYFDNIPKDISEDNFYSNSLKKIFRINFLGQETILDLLKKDKPDERSESFLNLIDLSELNEIETAAKQQFGFNPKFQKKKRELEKLDEDKKKADALFQQKSWDSYKSYVDKVNEAKLIASKQIDQLKRDESKKWVKQFISDEIITSHSCYDFIDIIKVKLSRVEEQITTTTKQKKNKDDFEGCKQAILLFNKNKKIDFIKEFKFDTSQYFLSGYNRYITKYDDKKEQLNHFEVLIKTNENLIEEYLTTQLNEDTVFKDCNIDVAKFTSVKVKLNKLHNFLKQHSQLYKVFDSELKFEQFEQLKAEVDKISIYELQSLLQDFKTKKKAFNYSHAEKGKRLKELSTLNSDYVSLLNDVKQYIDATKTLKECPICLNEDFSGGLRKTSVDLPSSTSVKEQLTNIITGKVSSGNVRVNKLQKEFDDEQKEFTNLEKDTKAKFIEDYHSKIESLNKGINEFIESLSSSISLSIKSIDLSIRKTTSRQSTLAQRVDQYKKYYLEIFDEEFPEIDERKTIDVALTNDNKASIEKIKKRINIDQERAQTSEEFVSLRDELKPKVTKVSIEDLREKVEDAKQTIEILKTFDDFVLSKADQQLIQTTLDFDKKVEEIRKQQTNIKNDSDIVSAIKNNAAKLKSEILEKLYSNKLINHIYEEINPHFRFNKMNLIKEEVRKQVHSNISYDGIYLNQIFSASQLNIISLSIFLGMGLPEKGSNFKQLFLDDPIQSMDDLNILALIDVFRELVDIPNAKRLVLSTHDDNFSKLLRIKMRNKNIKVIDFESYGNEGPVITMN